MTSPGRRTYAGVFFVASSMLLLQIALTKFFSFRLWYHYAFMIISITMLGLGASGSFLALRFRSLAAKPHASVLGALTLAAGAATLVALAILTFQTHAGVAEISKGTVASFVGLASYWIILFFPFFFAGCVISFALATGGEATPKIYAADLVGAACGCLVAVAVLSRVLVEQAIALAAALAFVGAACFAASRRRALLLSAAGLAASLVVAFTSRSLFGDAITRTKGLYSDLQVGRLVATRAGINGRVDVVAGSLHDFAWGLSKGNRAPVPEQLAIRIDGDAMTSVTRWDGDFGKWAFTASMPSSLPYTLGRPKRVLIIGPGGGMDVVNAVGHGATDVSGVEINRSILDLMHGPLLEFAGGIYEDSRVTVIHGDARSTIERSAARYDLIQMTLVDTFAAIASGALALSEDFLYTREAFAAYIAHLSPEGMLALGRSAGEAPGLLALVDAVTRGRGIDLARHVFAARNPDSLHGLIFVFQNAPFTSAQVDAGLAFTAAAGFQVVYAPGHEDLSDPRLVAFLRSPDRDAFIRDSPTDIAPETDDAPFYFRSSKWTQILGTYSGGRGNLLIILGVALVFGFAAIVVPLLARARLPLRRYRAGLAVFVMIGFGYVMIEMILLMKLALFLGHPVYSLSVTLFALLLFSGLGSACGGWLIARLRLPALVPLAGVVLFGLLAWWGLSDLLRALLHLGFWARVTVASVLIAPIGLCMGMPLPLTLRALADGPPELAGWAWGLNGVASVLGSVAVILIAQEIGYSGAFLIAIACYVAAGICVLLAPAPDHAASRAN